MGTHAIAEKNRVLPNNPTLSKVRVEEELYPWEHGALLALAITALEYKYFCLHYISLISHNRTTHHWRLKNYDMAPTSNIHHYIATTYFRWHFLFFFSFRYYQSILLPKFNDRNKSKAHYMHLVTKQLHIKQNMLKQSK